jgi:membrane protein
LPQGKNVSVLSEIWKLLRDTVLSFIEDEALSRGAEIALYAVTSVAPVLLIVIAIAGLVSGQDAAENAIVVQLSDLMGLQTAEVLQSAVASAASKFAGTIATIIGVIQIMIPFAAATAWRTDLTRHEN